MRWLKNLAIKWAMDDSSQKESGFKMSLADSDGDETIRFFLTPAIGGRILRVSRESHRPTVGFQSDTQTYIIPAGEDLGARVTKIINLEVLK